MSPSRRSRPCRLPPPRAAVRPSRRRNAQSRLIEPLKRRLLLSDVKIALANAADAPDSLLENTHQYLYVSANMIPFDTVITVHYEVLGGSATQGTDVIITGTLTLGDILLGGLGGGYR